MSGMPFGDSFYMSAGSFAAETIDNRRASGQLDDLIECETEHLPGSAESLRTDEQTNKQTNRQSWRRQTDGRKSRQTAQRSSSHGDDGVGARPFTPLERSE